MTTRGIRRAGEKFPGRFISGLSLANAATIGPRSNSRLPVGDPSSECVSEVSPAIAVVDDEEPVRKALRRLLRALGFEVELFCSGEEFLTSINTRQPDCAILDLHLPGLSGLEVQRELSRTNTRLPCILITGKDEPGTADRALAAGASAYLRKPVDQDELLSAISAAVPRQIDANSFELKKVEIKG